MRPVPGRSLTGGCSTAREGFTHYHAPVGRGQHFAGPGQESISLGNPSFVCLLGQVGPVGVAAELEPHDVPDGQAQINLKLVVVRDEVVLAEGVDAVDVIVNPLLDLIPENLGFGLFSDGKDFLDHGVEFLVVPTLALVLGCADAGEVVLHAAG